MSDKEKIEAYLGYKIILRVHNKALAIGINIIFFGACLFLAITKKVTPISIPIFLAVLYLILILFILLNKEKGKLYGRMLSIILFIASCEYLMMVVMEIPGPYNYYWILGVQICIGVISYFIMKKIYINKMISNISDYEVKEESSVSELGVQGAFTGAGGYVLYKITKSISGILAFGVLVALGLVPLVVCFIAIGKLSYIYNNGYMYVVERAEEKYYGPKAQAKAAKKLAEQKRKEEKLEELRQNKKY